MRYAVTIDLYLWANSDEEAREQAKKLCRKLNRAEDCDAAPISLHTAPFGSMKNEEVKL